MKLTVEILRTYQEKQTIGEMQFALGDERHKYMTLELPWRNNERRVSCIPEGEYQVVRRNSAKYGDHFHVLNVPGRDMILIHVANFVKELLGCIAVGKSHIDINGDGWKDVSLSGPSLKELNKLLPDSFTLIIKRA